jgi:hypothetical protein
MQEETPQVIARANQRQWRKHRVLGIVLATCLGIVLTLTTAPQVFAAVRNAANPLCSGQNCNGKDPYATLCAGQS